MSAESAMVVMMMLRGAALLTRVPLRPRRALAVCSQRFRTSSTSAALIGARAVSESDANSGSRRFRQHVNPLAMQYREPIALPDWKTTFADTSLPIHLDIGCARGKYLMQVAQANVGRMNYVGVEIRQNVILDAIEEAKRREIANLAFVHANMNFQQKLLIPSLPRVIESVSIFHPDPWMKKRHLKRRLVTDEFVNELADLLRDGTPIYVQTDVEELFEYMVEVFEQSRRYEFDVLLENPFGVPTDREKFVRDQGGDIYRVKFVVNTDDGEVASPSSTRD